MCDLFKFMRNSLTIGGIKVTYVLFSFFFRIKKFISIDICYKISMSFLIAGYHSVGNYTMKKEGVYYRNIGWLSLVYTSVNNIGYLINGFFPFL